MFLDAIVPGDRSPYTRHRVVLQRSVINLRLRITVESYIQTELGRVEIGPLESFSFRKYPNMVRDLLLNQVPVRIRHEVEHDLAQTAGATT